MCIYTFKRIQDIEKCIYRKNKAHILLNKRRHRSSRFFGEIHFSFSKSIRLH